MEEMKGPSLPLPLNHLSSKLIILFKKDRQILFRQCIFIRRLGHHRLHRNLLKAQICQMKNISGKIRIKMGKGSTDIILILIPAFRKFLELGNDQIVAACPIPERPHPVVNLSSPINTQNHIIHLTVGKFHNVII